MEELKVIIEQKSGIIDFSNFEQLKEQLLEYLEEYRGATFTEESKTFAKTVVADLRKLKRAVNDRKIEVKKAFMQPYEEFEAKTKELLATIDEPITLIDSQVQVFEQKRVAERKEQIQAIYNEIIGDMAGYASLSCLYSSKWENASTSVKKIREEMEQILLGIRMDVESLKLMRVSQEIIEYALEQYKKGSTAVEAMRRANEFAELEDRRKKEAGKKAVETKADAFPVPASATEQEENFDLAFETPSTKTAVYRVVASTEKINQLEYCMLNMGISYERMEK